MDPISIAASLAGLATAAHDIVKLIHRLRSLAKLPQKIFALADDVSDLGAVLQEVSKVAEEGSLVPDQSSPNLGHMIFRNQRLLERIALALKMFESELSKSKIKIVIKTALWDTADQTFAALRSEVEEAKTSLTILLGRTNSQHLRRIDLRVAQSAQSVQTATDTLQQGITAVLTMSTKLDQQFIDHFNEPHGHFRPLRWPQHEPARVPGQMTSELLMDLADRAVCSTAPDQRLCRHWCPCRCHRKQKLSFKAPGVVEAMMGKLFFGYSGLPFLKQQCDFRGCQDQRRAVATIEYRFPSWLLSTNAKLHFKYVPNAGPEYQLSAIRRVADDSQSITLAMQGDIEGLKHLFAKGLAGPRDVSSSRGYTLVRWALYGGMHNHQTVQFLIGQGAKVDEESYDNVWDFIYRGKCTEPQQRALRCITDGGEGDWTDEQNFPLIHRIVLGISQKSLATELGENRHSIHLTDAQNRTALDWATARSQFKDMELLLAHGADPNNMDLTGRTAVLHAVDSHSVQGLRLILDHGGNPNPKYPKDTFRSSPLTAAGFAGKPELLRVLLQKEAEVNVSNPEGLTALHSVAQTTNTECAAMLLESGADLNAMSNNNQTPLTIAIMRNNHAMLQLFMDNYYGFLTHTRFAGKLPCIAHHLSP